MLQTLNDVMSYAPMVIAIMVCANALMVGLYAAFSKILDSAKQFSDNIYLISIAKVAKFVLKLLDIIGFHPKRIDIEQAIQKNKEDIQEIKNNVV